MSFEFPVTRNNGMLFLLQAFIMLFVIDKVLKVISFKRIFDLFSVQVFLPPFMFIGNTFFPVMFLCYRFAFGYHSTGITVCTPAFFSAQSSHIAQIAHSSIDTVKKGVFLPRRHVKRSYQPRASLN